VVPNYNHAPYLEERLNSIWNQTFRDFELIFLDDASTDDSLAVAGRFAREHPMRIVPNEQNSGSPFVQWNKALRLASAEWIWIAESDDVANPRFLERLTAVLAAHPEAGLAYCSSRRIDGQGTPGIRAEDNLRGLHESRWNSDFVADGLEECRVYMSRLNTIANASAVLFRKSVYESIGAADESFRFCGDWDLWCRMLAVSKVAFVAEELNFHRLHAGSVRSKSSQERALSERARVLLNLHQRHGLSAEIRREAIAVLLAKAVRHLREGNLGFRPALAVILSLEPLDRGMVFSFAAEWGRQFYATRIRRRAK
jgi:GT2 family glycosyltransferase